MLEADPKRLTVVRCAPVWAVVVCATDDPLAFCFFTEGTWEFFAKHYGAADEEDRKRLVSIVREG